MASDPNTVAVAVDDSEPGPGSKNLTPATSRRGVVPEGNGGSKSGRSFFRLKASATGTRSGRLLAELKEFDKNNDGELSREELLDYVEAAVQRDFYAKVWKYAAIAFFVLLVLMVGVTFAMCFVAVWAMKDTKVENGALVADSGAAVPLRTSYGTGFLKVGIDANVDADVVTKIFDAVDTHPSAQASGRRRRRMQEGGGAVPIGMLSFKDVALPACGFANEGKINIPVEAFDIAADDSSVNGVREMQIRNYFGCDAVNRGTNGRAVGWGTVSYKGLDFEVDCYEATGQCVVTCSEDVKIQVQEVQRGQQRRRRLLSAGSDVSSVQRVADSSWVLEALGDNGGNSSAQVSAQAAERYLNSLPLEEQLEVLRPRVQALPSLPKHVAVIPDGNRRWAAQTDASYDAAYGKAIKTVHAVVDASAKWGIEALTLFVLAADNTKRPEYAATATFIAKALLRKLPELIENGVKVHAAGNVAEAPEELQSVINAVIAATANCTKFHLTLAVNYNSQADIVAAAARAGQLMVDGKLSPSELTPSMFQAFLSTAPVLAEVGPPDLVVRTSGELRLSNFLMWELSYAEIVSSPVLWPDFTPLAYAEALKQYSERERRFGGNAVDTAEGGSSGTGAAAAA